MIDDNQYDYLLSQLQLLIVTNSKTAFHAHNAVRYFGSFLGVAGSAGNIPAVLALTIGGAGVGGIVASTVFRSKDAPGYRPGLWVAISAQFVIILTTCALTVFYHYKNKAVREGRAPPIEGRPGFYRMY
ncbi:hypothetical protein PC9H_006798 [Pleurotus ostreatus]|uniref:Uncharacterized protein n=1 Tax=Pleurotus ostreatus TaxID=5322 RepID=A0A8H6ZXC9_PLEOS|nr:uncharacterized protein PC9H_006798 [Pleurotus ostreatus]KAF7431080.1 hypothetical protein PC9H_006798 [Pleurotus ostreatus]